MAEETNLDAGVVDRSNNWIRFGSKHNDIFPRLGDVVRWKVGLKPRPSVAKSLQRSTMDNVVVLARYHKYTRKEVHDIFVPDGKFTPNAGTWGLHGCVHVPKTDHDYVFFVTYGQTQAGFVFQEGISSEG